MNELYIQLYQRQGQLLSLSLELLESILLPKMVMQVFIFTISFISSFNISSMVISLFLSLIKCTK